MHNQDPITGPKPYKLPHQIEEQSELNKTMANVEIPVTDPSDKEEKDSTASKEIIPKENNKDHNNGTNDALTTKNIKVSEEILTLVSGAQKVLKSNGVEINKHKTHKDLNKQYLNEIPILLRQLNERATIKQEADNKEDIKTPRRTTSNEQLSESVQNLKEILSKLQPYSTPSVNCTIGSSLTPAQLDSKPNTTETPSRQLRLPEEKHNRRVRFTETLDVIMEEVDDSEEKICENTNKPDRVGTADIEEAKDGTGLRDLGYHLGKLNTMVDELRLIQGQQKSKIQIRIDYSPTTIIVS